MIQKTGMMQTTLSYKKYYKYSHVVNLNTKISDVFVLKFWRKIWVLSYTASVLA